MIMSVSELKEFIETDKTDKALEMMLQAMENAIHGYTNNNFKRVLEKNNGEYPADVKLGVVAMLKWKLKNEAANDGDKEQKDIQSETISRHSVTYVTDTTEIDLDEHFGVPKKHTAFLKPYKRARFGQGVGV